MATFSYLIWRRLLITSKTHSLHVQQICPRRWNGQSPDPSRKWPEGSCVVPPPRLQRMKHLLPVHSLPLSNDVRHNCRQNDGIQNLCSRQKSLAAASFGLLRLQIIAVQSYFYNSSKQHHPCQNLLLSDRTGHPFQSQCIYGSTF